ncbi:MAG TPA: hypothetical protein VJH95_00790 [Candidatus Nanoarchaeia archaeon]|nr:hypothetical protein [Candidatus Nanoarchaeia archaeon]
MIEKKLLVIFVMLLASAVFVNADFVLGPGEGSMENVGSVCKGSTLLFPVQVTGAGSFTLNLEGGAGGFSTAVPNGFVSAGEKMVYVYVSPNSRVLAGSYDLKLVVSDNANTKKQAFVIDVKDCNVFSVEGEGEKTVCGCESVQYKYKLKNTGVYKDSFALGVKSEIANWLVLSQDRLDLNPGEEREVSVNARPGCKEFGEYLFTLNVNSESNANVNLDNKLVVENCFDYGLEVEKNYLEICEHSAEKAEIRIDNNAVRANTYDLSLAGPGWANLENNRITLGAGSSGKTSILLNPGYRIEGVFDVTLKAKGSKGEIAKEKIMQVKVKKCHDFKLDILEESVRLCQGVDRNLSVKLVNNGEAGKEIKLVSDAEWAGLEEDTLELDGGESGELLLVLKGSNISAGKHSVNVKGTALDDSGVNAADKLGVVVIGRDECYLAEVSVDNAEVIRESTATIPINIKNIGVEAATYELGLSGNGAGFVQVNPGVVKINPGGSEIAYIYAAPSRTVSYGDYGLTVNVRNKESGISVVKGLKISVKEPVKEELTANVVAVRKESLAARILGWFSTKFGKKENGTAPLANGTTTTLGTTTILETTTTLEETTTTLETTTTIATTTTSGGLTNVDIRFKPVISEDTAFRYGNESHTLKISEIGNNSVTIVINSEPVIVIARLNETKSIDINGDGKEDITVKLTEIKDGKPLMELAAIGEQGQGIDYRNYLIMGIVVLVVLVLIGIFAFKSDKEGMEKEAEEENVEEKKIVKEEEIKEEDMLEDEAKMPVGRYVLLMILLAVAAWLGFKYNVLTELADYKYYVLLGVVVLVLLILLIKYWKGIIDFFEEEIEEEKSDDEEKTQDKTTGKKAAAQQPASMNESAAAINGRKGLKTKKEAGKKRIVKKQK